ncbi:sterile alpha motif domain-containing protein 1 [Equus caballus]|uniref:sterile alpha motif domain-containing protein 1 n=1 Tax=Equus caballus TaxID=9796 RepID=UPI0038B2C105
MPSPPEWKRGRLAPGPAPSDPPLCHPPRDKLGGTRTSARVWPFWSLPTEADRGHRGRQGYPRGTPIPRPRAPPSASPAGQPKRCSGAHLTSPQTVSLPPPREPPHPSCHPLRRRPGAAGPSPGPSAGRRLTWRGGRQDGGKWRPGGAGRGRAPGAGGGGGGSGCCRYSCRSVQLLLRHRLLGLPRCQERPKRGSASSQSLPGELQPATSAGARPPSRACAPAACPAQALPERSSSGGRKSKIKMPPDSVPGWNSDMMSGVGKVILNNEIQAMY